MSDQVLEKDDIAFVTDLLEHYKRRFQKVREGLEDGRTYDALFFEDIDGVMNSALNLTNRLKGMETVDLKNLTGEEVELISNSVEVFIADSLALKNDLKKEFGKVAVKNLALDRKLSHAKLIGEKIQVEE